MTRRGLTLLAGAGCLGVGVALTLSWHEIATLYHLHRLRGDAGHFSKILDRAEGTPEKAGVRKYLSSKEGKVALLRECMQKNSERLRDHLAGGQATHVMITSKGPRLVLEGTTPDGGQVFLNSRRLDARLSLLVQGHFTRNEDLSFEEYPGIRFEYDPDPDATRVASRQARRASRP